MWLDYSKYKHKFTADFETSTAAWGVDKARVWLWDICNVSNLKHTQGIDIKSFIDKILSIGKAGYESIIIAFHNLAYDGNYLLYHLIEQGYTAAPADPSPQQFATLITHYGDHYAYEINFGVQCKYHKPFIVTIVDSLKTIPMSVEKIAEAFKLPIKKGEIDYNKYREIGYEPTEEEIEYIKNDTEIMARALQVNFSQRLTKVTQPANSLAEFKRLYGKTNYEMSFPNDLNDSYLRNAYFGGMCYASPKHLDKILTGLISFDINSMYPAAMLHARLPIGYPEYYVGDCRKVAKENEVFIQRFKCAYDLKPNKIPTLFKNRHAISGELHSTTSDFRVFEMTLTNLDLEMLFENYYVYSFQPLDGYIFQTQKGYEPTPEEFKNLSYREYIEIDGKGSIFYEYIKKWRQVKENNEGALRDIAKRMQNMLYGNFGKRIDGIIKLPFIDDKGILKFQSVEAGQKRVEYVPMAAFITASCRYNLVKDILKHYDDFVYCDTDSMYLFDTADTSDMLIHDKLYGAYKVEKIISRFKCLGSKRYLCEYHKPNDNEIKFAVTCCGANGRVREQLTFENFVYDAQFDGKRTVKSVVGGKHIVGTTYKLKRG